MNLRFVFPTIATVLLVVSSAFAQHSDVEFGYDDVNNPSAFEVEVPGLTSEGFGLFEAEMEELDPMGDPGNFSADEPGFTTNDAEGLLINTGDEIWLRILDASSSSMYGAGYVNYYNPTTGMIEDSGRIGVIDNTASTLDLVLNGGNIESGPNPQFLGIGDIDGDLHDHLIFDLLDDSTAPLGAYGVLVQLETVLGPSDGTGFSSDPFWFVFNHGMSEEDFDELALPQFGAVEEVPEPGSIAVLAMFGSALLLRRKRA